jgi:hypothetical protein
VNEKNREGSGVEAVADGVLEFARQVVASPDARGYGTPGNVLMLAEALVALADAAPSPDQENAP